MPTHYGPKVVTDGLVLALDAADRNSYPGSGTAWTDLSGNGNNGTLTNGPTYNSANGGSIVFDGTNDAISLSNITPTSGASFSAWININGSNSNYGTIFANWSDVGGGTAYWIGTLNNQSTTIQVYFNGSLISDITSLPLNTWMLLTISHTGSICKGYINAIERFSLSSTLTTSTNNTSIGYDITRTNYPFKGNIAQASIYNRALTAAEISQNYNALRSRFIITSPPLDGSTADRAAPSASHLVSLGITTDGVYWIDLPTAGPTQIYCILNPAYDGGGWMMAMKATTGTTFNYSANYWTTANTLNPTENNRNNGDAKFNSMNYFQSKDIMAIWPDISNGGSIPSSTLGWTWLQNNFNDGTRITPISFFGITYPTMNFGGSGKFIQDAKTFSGWASGVFSSQVDIRFYGFNYANNTTYFGSSNAKVRWGFGWNENGEGLYPGVDVGGVKGSNDVSGGIGMDSGHGSYSAGDRINCCQDTTGINRTARVEVYVR